MSLTIDDDEGRMRLFVGDVYAQAVRADDGTWSLPGDAGTLTAETAPPARPGRFTRDQAITALTIIELTQQGYGEDHPLIKDLESELNA